MGRDLPVRLWAGRHLQREVAALVRGGTRVLTVAPTAATRETMARSGMSEAVRAPAARAAYRQILDTAEALRRQLG